MNITSDTDKTLAKCGRNDKYPFNAVQEEEDEEEGKPRLLLLQKTVESRSTKPRSSAQLQT